MTIPIDFYVARQTYARKEGSTTERISGETNMETYVIVMI